MGRIDGHNPSCGLLELLHDNSDNNNNNNNNVIVVAESNKRDKL